MKILIVEDDRILSDTIKQCICKKFDTAQAYDGYEGYSMAKENRGNQYRCFFDLRRGV